MIRTSKKKAGLLAAGTAAALVLVSACGSGSTGTQEAPNPGHIDISGKNVSLNDYNGAKLAIGEPKKGGSLKVGMITAVDSLDPNLALSTGGIGVAQAVYDSLMWIDSNGKVVPQLAQSLESTDSQHYTLKLRSGVKFTDGTPLNADAVVDHLTKYIAAKKARDAGTVAQATGITKTDDLTVSITLKAPNADWPFVLTGGAGWIPSPAAVASEGAGFGQKPVGAGPFKVQGDVQSGKDIILVRNDGYFDSRYPYLDQMTFVTAIDNQARLAALQSGDLDLASTTNPADFKVAKDAGLTVLQQPTYSYLDIMFNTAKPPFDDVTVRKAIMQAINTDGISKAKFGGLAQPMKGWFVENHPAFTQVDYPKYDVAAAKKAIDAYKAKGGNPDFTLVTNTPDFKDVASLIIPMLSDIGVTMTYKGEDQSTMITEAASGNYEAQLRFIGFTLQASVDLATRFSSTSTGHVFAAAADQTHGDPALDQIITKLGQTPADQRKDLYAQAQQEIAKWIPIVPLVQQTGAWIVGKKVGGYPGTQGEQTTDIFTAKLVWAK